LGNIAGIQIPKRQLNSTHVFHQYTLIVKEGKRDQLKAYLQDRGVPSMVYYPLPLYAQQAFQNDRYKPEDFPISQQLCASVLSLPIHTEMDEGQLRFITAPIIDFFGSSNHE
jgi:UDP-2-acetamido-2-deoxy-ribo-hexuluronate aminotransferase